MTSDAATRTGAKLFERVIRTGGILPWERRLLQYPHLMRDNIRGAVLGQTFALLSGDAAHRTIADAYHGTLISVSLSSLRQGVGLIMSLSLLVPQTFSPRFLSTASTK